MSISAKVGVFAYCPSHVQFFKNQGRWYARGTATPQRGWVIFFTTDGVSAAHVGYVTGVSGGIVYTVEGNTRSGTALVANGGGVFEKSYYLTSTYILGYGAPAYAAGEAEKVIQIALSYVGYLEKASNAYLDDKTKNAGTANYTRFGRWYDQVANGGKSGFINAEWCDMFVSCCAAEADGSGGSSGGVATPSESVSSMPSIQMFQEPKDYQNGSTDEICYADVLLDKSEKTGSLNTWEACKCLGIIGGRPLVFYHKDDTDDWKIGLVEYDGGVNA